MALFMVANDLTPEQVADPSRDIAFPESVISLFKGELGLPPDGFPVALTEKVLRGGKPMTDRPGKFLEDVDLEAARAEAEAAAGHKIDDNDLASWLMYPKVYKDYATHHRAYGDVSVIPTPTFFYGMEENDEVSVDIDTGKTLIIRLQGTTSVPEEGEEKLFYELNGQPRVLRIERADSQVKKVVLPKAEDGNPNQIGAPMPGMVVTVAVKAGQKVVKGDPLVSIEAMKMETQIRAEFDATVKRVAASVGQSVGAKDLLVELTAP